jgi:hypothetical protein
MRFPHDKVEGMKPKVVGMTMAARTPMETLGALVLELRARPGRLGVLAEAAESNAALTWMSAALNWDILKVGRVLAHGNEPPTADQIERALDGSHVFVDCEVLFDALLEIEPIQLFRRLARRNPSFIVWSGDIRHGTFSYSRIGRPDHFEETIRDAIVLRPREPSFPDEFPFTIERI